MGASSKKGCLFRENSGTIICSSSWNSKPVMDLVDFLKKFHEDEIEITQITRIDIKKLNIFYERKGFERFS